MTQHPTIRRVIWIHLPLTTHLHMLSNWYYFPMLIFEVKYILLYQQEDIFSVKNLRQLSLRLNVRYQLNKLDHSAQDINLYNFHNGLNNIFVTGLSLWIYKRQQQHLSIIRKLRASICLWNKKMERWFRLTVIIWSCFIGVAWNKEFSLNFKCSLKKTFCHTLKYLI